MPLNDQKIVLVTGGGTGIGRATALRFAADGAIVFVCGRNLNTLQETSVEGQRLKGIVEPHYADVTDTVSVTVLVEHILNRFGKIDVLVNCAGQAFAKSVLETSELEWNDILNVNLLGTVNCCKSVLPSMMETGEGVIITISSVLGKKAIGSMAAYCASKFAICGFTQALAAETKDVGVRVHAVCPGATDTPLHRRIVGEEQAAKAMHSDRVAELIHAIAVQSVYLRTGEDIAIDNGQVVAQPGLFQKVAYSLLNKLRF